MEKNKKHFISTADSKTAEMLRELGFHELNQEGGRWMFVNEPNKIVFSSDDTKIVYTDILTFS